MRIALLTPEFDGSGGGIMTFYRHLVPALVEHGHEVRVIVGSRWATAATDDRREREGFTVEIISAGRYGQAFNELSHLAAAPILRKQLAAALAVGRQLEVGPVCDVVEATDFGLLAVGPLIAGGPPTIIQMHGSEGQIALMDPQPGQGVDDVLSLAIESELVRHCGIICSSTANRSYWERQGARTASVSAPAWSREHACGNPEPVDKMVVLGRIQRWKGPDVLCKAVAALGKKCPDVDWYGRDMESGILGRSTSERLSLEYPNVWGNRIKAHPPVPAAEAASIQAAARVNIVPSSWDIFNFTAVEALASGAPLVCSDGAGASELIEDGVSGFVFPRDNSDALAAKLENALTMSAQRRRSMAEAALDVLSSRLSPAKTAAIRTQFYMRAKEERNILAEIPNWIVDMCQPSGRRGDTPFSHLNTVPLRHLASYVGRRLVRRVWRSL